MPLHLVGHVLLNENEPQALARFLDRVQPLLDQLAITELRRHRLEPQDGSGIAELVVIFEAPHHDAVQLLHSAMEDPRTRADRTRAFSTFSLTLMA